MNAVLAAWNGAEAVEAAAAILPCNGALAWAAALAARRPFGSEEALLAASDAVWAGLDPTAWQEAFASHPRLGEHEAKTATEASLRWSAGEQSGLSTHEEARAALVDGNREYERRFRRTFLVCATGKSAAEVLAILRARLPNDDAAEWREAGEQQRRITQLRLRKWLGLPAAGCEDV